MQRSTSNQEADSTQSNLPTQRPETSGVVYTQVFRGEPFKQPRLERAYRPYMMKANSVYLVFSEMKNQHQYW